jgi:hypothetical protein
MMEEVNVCKCCGQEVTTPKSFDEAHAESLVVWDNEAHDIAEEWLYALDAGPELNSWESLKIYRLLAEDVKTQIKRFYKIH